MKLFIFEKVLSDYTDGLVVIAAKTLKQAQQFAQKEFYPELTISQVIQEEGWDVPAAVYNAGNIEPGVKHYVHGGA